MSTFVDEFRRQTIDPIVEEFLDSVQPPATVSLDLEPPIAAYLLWILCTSGLPPWAPAVQYGLKSDDIRGFCIFLQDQLPPEFQTELPPVRQRRSSGEVVAASGGCS